jgi:hypothetical protein
MTDTINRRIESISIKNPGAAPIVTLKTGVEGIADADGNPTLKPKTNTLDEMGYDLPENAINALAMELLLRLAGDTAFISSIRLKYPKTNARNGLSLVPCSASFDVVIPKGTAALEKDLKISGITIAIPGQELNLDGSGEFATKDELRHMMDIITAVDAADIEDALQGQIPNPYQQLSLLPPEDLNRESIATKAARQQLSIESAIDESSEAASDRSRQGLQTTSI